MRYSPDAPEDASIQLPIGSGGWFLIVAIGVLVLWHGVPAARAKWRAWRLARLAKRVARVLKRKTGE